MTLQAQLNAIKAKSESRIPPESLQVMHEATEALEKSGMKERALGLGDRIPEFALLNINGVLVTSRTLVEKGPLVLTFYRGKW